MSYLSRFTFGMLILITGENRVQLFVGWEAVGVCSYLLINYWYTRIQANKSARKAMIMNRVGDVGLALGRLRIYNQYGALDYGTIYSRACTDGNTGDLWLVGVGLMIGAMGKSAQLGLHTWLPDAMEGPTPVSALIHAATMVTAGVYRMARCSPRLEFEPEVLQRITRLGGATAVYAGTVGRVQNDLKRVIAYSTCSQLGYMIMATGLSNYEIAVFHLANHALFKALLFLSAGAVIHGMADEQDMRRYGGLAKRMPLSYAMMRIGSVSLMGFPFRTGYYSKDAIREAAYGTYSWSGHLGHTLGLMAAFGTGAYSLRLRQRTFRAPVGGYRKVMEGAHDAPILMGVPMRILSVGGVWVGWLTKDAMIGPGTGFWGQALFVHPDALSILDGEFRDTPTKRLPVIIGRIGGAAGMAATGGFHVEGSSGTNRKQVAYNRKVDQRKTLYVFFSKKWYFDKVYNQRVGANVAYMGHHHTYKRIDRGIIEMMGPMGVGSFVYSRGQRRNKVQTGDRVEYLVYLVYGYTARLAGVTRWLVF
jgi:NADH-ubiquinone oxidoreductase chain 5